MANTQKSSQDFLPIKEIRDGVVILKDGTLRMVLMASSLNFALKSEDEQQAIIMQYQNFLNSLDFTIQIYLQSRKLDIRPYLEILEDRLKEQTNELIKLQTREYMEFIKNFTESTNIMTKSFFIIIPYSPSTFNTQSGWLSNILPGGGKNNKVVRQEEQEDWQEYKVQLEQRAGIVIDGLNRFGVKSVILGTDELVELYYKIFNPGEIDVPTTKTEDK